MRLAVCLAPFLTLAACVPQPPAPAVARQGTAVEAPAGRTWDAVIDVFAERNIPIRTMDRGSGFIATDALNVNDRTPRPGEYDCGKDAIGIASPATTASYNVLVRPVGADSARSTVKVTVRWVSVQKESQRSALSTSDTPVAVECTSQGGWESRAEAEIKARAEAK